MLQRYRITGRDAEFSLCRSQASALAWSQHTDDGCAGGARMPGFYTIVEAVAATECVKSCEMLIDAVYL